jgi:hypothetical protein
MPKKTPKQIVQDKFGTRAKLIAALLPLLEDDVNSDTERRLKGSTNEKLLTLHRAATEVRARFQSKRNLVAEIARKRFPARDVPDPKYAAKIGKLSVKRLLDLHRQVSSHSRSAASGE